METNEGKNVQVGKMNNNKTQNHSAVTSID